MENEVFGTIKKSLKYWYLPLILGILFLLTGIWIFLTPAASFLTLSVLFAFTFLVAGIIEIVYAISNRKILDSWGWALLSGILGLAFGILLLSRPDISLLALGYLVGLGVLFYSIIALGRSIKLKRYHIAGWGYSMFISVIGIIISFLIIWNPLFGGLTIIMYAALSFTILGVFQIYLAIKLKKLHQKLEN